MTNILNMVSSHCQEPNCPPATSRHRNIKSNSVVNRIQQFPAPLSAKVSTLYATGQSRLTKAGLYWCKQETLSLPRLNCLRATNIVMSSPPIIVPKTSKSWNKNGHRNLEWYVGLRKHQIFSYPLEPKPPPKPSQGPTQDNRRKKECCYASHSRTIIWRYCFLMLTHPDSLRRYDLLSLSLDNPLRSTLVSHISQLVGLQNESTSGIWPAIATFLFLASGRSLSTSIVR